MLNGKSIFILHSYCKLNTALFLVNAFPPLMLFHQLKTRVVSEVLKALTLLPKGYNAYSHQVQYYILLTVSQSDVQERKILTNYFNKVPNLDQKFSRRLKIKLRKKKQSNLIRLQYLRHPTPQIINRSHWWFPYDRHANAEIDLKSVTAIVATVTAGGCFPYDRYDRWDRT